MQFLKYKLYFRSDWDNRKMSSAIFLNQNWKKVNF